MFIVTEYAALKYFYFCGGLNQGMGHSWVQLPQSRNTNMDYVSTVVKKTRVTGTDWEKYHNSAQKTGFLKS